MRRSSHSLIKKITETRGSPGELRRSSTGGGDKRHSCHKMRKITIFLREIMELPGCPSADGF